MQDRQAATKCHDNLIGLLPVLISNKKAAPNPGCGVGLEAALA
jgi:hypothetical protein